MATTPSSRKAKGRRLQQFVAQCIGDILGLPVGPDEMIASREMGQAGTDVRLIADAKRGFPFSIECKNQESWGIHSWIAQAQRNLEKNTDWMLVCKRNRTEPVVVLDWNAFLDIYNRLILLEKLNKGK